MDTINQMPEMAGKPLSELSEEEKQTPSEMYPDENAAEPGEADPEKKASEETPESETETPEEESKEGEEEQLEVQEEEQEPETPEPTPKSSDNAEEDREIKGLKAQEEKLKAQILENIVNLRAQKRQTAEPKAPEPVSQPTDEEGVDPEIAKQLDGWAAKKGLVPEAQIREKIHKEALIGGMNKADKEFFGKYPEYAYSQDLRNEFEGIVDNLKEPTSAEEYQKNLDLAHNIIKQNHPDRFPSSSGDATAKKQALKTAGLGAGSHSAPSSVQPAVDPAKVAMARRFYKEGFTEEEIMKYARKIK